jgi:hypothetical protein
MRSKFKTTHFRKADLMEIGVKIFGLYYLLVALISFKTILLMWVAEMSFSSQYGNTGSTPYSMVLPYLFNLGFDLAVAWFFLFRTKMISRAILKEDTDREGAFTIDKKSILQISAIVLGGLVVTDAIETIGSQLIGIYQSVQGNFLLRPGTIPELIWQCVYGTIGYALITASGAIADRFSNGKRQINKDPEWQFTTFPQWKIAPNRIRGKRPRIPVKRNHAEQKT